MGVVMGEGAMGCSSVVHASVNESVMCIAVRGHALRCWAHVCDCTVPYHTALYHAVMFSLELKLGLGLRLGLGLV